MTTAILFTMTAWVGHAKTVNIIVRILTATIRAWWAAQGSNSTQKAGSCVLSSSQSSTRSVAMALKSWTGNRDTWSANLIQIRRSSSLENDVLDSERPVRCHGRERLAMMGVWTTTSASFAAA